MVLLVSLFLHAKDREWSLTEKITIRGEIIEVPLLDLCGECWDIGASDLHLTVAELHKYGHQYHSCPATKQKTDAAREARRKPQAAVEGKHGWDSTSSVTSSRQKIVRVWDLYSEKDLRSKTGRTRMPKTSLEQAMQVSVPDEADPSKTELLFAFPHEVSFTGRMLVQETEIATTTEEPSVRAGYSVYDGQAMEVWQRSAADNMQKLGVKSLIAKDPLHMNDWLDKWTKKNEDEPSDEDGEEPGKVFGGAGSSMMAKQLQSSSPASKMYPPRLRQPTQDFAGASPHSSWMPSTMQHHMVVAVRLVALRFHRLVALRLVAQRLVGRQCM